jgi:DegV family protein with EDD domain
MTVDTSEAYAVSATVEEFEEFFAEALTQADFVMHISMAEHCGKTYQTAMQAAQGFDHVHVVDSGQISVGEAMLAMQAAQLAKEGYRIEEVYKAVEALKKKLQALFILPTVNIFYQRGFSNKFAGEVCKMFHAHPIVAVKDSRLQMKGARVGNLEWAWKRFIHFHLRFPSRINSDIIMITHAGLSYKQQQLLKEEVLKCVPFKQVMILKASFSSASNAGILSIGLAYFLKE